MVQLGEVRCAGGTRHGGQAQKRSGARIAAAFALAAAATIAAATTAHADDTTPAKSSGAAAPAKPTDAAPAKPSEATPTKPSEARPATSSEGTPAKAAEAAPAKSTDAAPARDSDPTEAAEESAHEQVARENAQCATQLALAEDAIARDAKYARNWTDAWYVTGTSLIVLNLTNVFMVHDYRRSEAIVFGAMSTLLMIQLPTATTSAKALRGIRAAGTDAPCLALTSARYVLETNADDARLHTNAFAYAVPVALQVITGVVLALAEHHWDFAGHGAEGLSTLVGIAAGELQVATYPRSSLKVSGTSLQMTF